MSFFWYTSLRFSCTDHLTWPFWASRVYFSHFYSFLFCSLLIFMQSLHKTTLVPKDNSMVFRGFGFFWATSCFVHFLIVFSLCVCLACYFPIFLTFHTHYFNVPCSLYYFLYLSLRVTLIVCQFTNIPEEPLFWHFPLCYWCFQDFLCVYTMSACCFTIMQ